MSCTHVTGRWKIIGDKYPVFSTSKSMPITLAKFVLRAYGMISLKDEKCPIATSTPTMRKFTSQGKTKTTKGKANESDEYYNEHTRVNNLISRVCITVEEHWSSFSCLNLAAFSLSLFRVLQRQQPHFHVVHCCGGNLEHFAFVSELSLVHTN